MDKPEKKEAKTRDKSLDSLINIYNGGYNQACDDWEKYCDWQYKMCQKASAKGMKDTLNDLPSEEEIRKIIYKQEEIMWTFHDDEGFINNGTTTIEDILSTKSCKRLAKAIHKRIRGE